LRASLRFGAHNWQQRHRYAWPWAVVDCSILSISVYVCQFVHQILHVYLFAHHSVCRLSACNRVCSSVTVATRPLTGARARDSWEQAHKHEHAGTSTDDPTERHPGTDDPTERHAYAILLLALDKASVQEG
jgi:hypothetical protein